MFMDFFPPTTLSRIFLTRWSETKLPTMWFLIPSSNLLHICRHCISLLLSSLCTLYNPKRLTDNSMIMHFIWRPSVHYITPRGWQTTVYDYAFYFFKTNVCSDWGTLRRNTKFCEIKKIFVILNYALLCVFPIREFLFFVFVQFSEFFLQWPFPSLVCYRCFFCQDVMKRKKNNAICGSWNPQSLPIRYLFLRECDTVWSLLLTFFSVNLIFLIWL